MLLPNCWHFRVLAKLILGICEVLASQLNTLTFQQQSQCGICGFLGEAALLELNRVACKSSLSEMDAFGHDEQYVS